MNVTRSSLLPYSATQIFHIIEQVQQYPEFLKWCDGAEVLSSNANQVVAKLHIAYGALRFSFSTRNDMVPNRVVSLNLVDGPFSRLQGQWTIDELSATACKVSLNLDFNFASKVTQNLFGRVFKNIISAQLDAFEKRADELYGDSR